MRRMLLVCALMFCLVAVLGLSGCLFGKKGGDEGGEVSAGPEGPSEGPGEAAGPAEGPPEPEGALPGPKPEPPRVAPPPAVKPGGDPAQAKSLLAQARQAKASTDYDRAISLAQQAADADPGNADAHWLMAWMYAEQGQKDKAIGEFNAFVAGAGDDPRVGDAKAALERLGAAGGPPGALEPPGPPGGG